MADPMSNAEKRRREYLIKEKERAILEEAAERVRNIKQTIHIELDNQRRIFHQGIDYAIMYILEPITKEKS